MSIKPRVVAVRVINKGTPEQKTVAYDIQDRNGIKVYSPKGAVDYIKKNGWSESDGAKAVDINV